MRVVDSHTAGEPTRVIVEGGPDLGTGPLAERVGIWKSSFDQFRQLAINEPRGYDAVVGALLCEPVDSSCAAGVIYFNNAGYLNMCGHGTIGVAVTLHYLGRIGLGTHRLETPVGVVEIELLDANHVAIRNVPSYRYRTNVTVEVTAADALPGTFSGTDPSTVIETHTGDIAWGGNWFFLANESPFPLTLENQRALNDSARRLKNALDRQGITGEDGGEIDHLEFFGPAESTDANSRNYVLCPGGEYDRSPCGTGTSAKLACLAADGKLAAGVEWVQESIIGSRFTGSWQPGEDGRIIPGIRGHAYISSEGQLIQQLGDPFPFGIGGAVS